MSFPVPSGQSLRWALVDAAGPAAAFAALVIALSSPGRAAMAAEVPALSQRQLLERIDRVDPRLGLLEARVEAARALIAEARRHPNPSLAVDRESVAVGGQSQPENFIRLELPLSLFGARGKRIAAAEAGVEAARAMADRDRTLLRFDALDVFHDAAAARLQVEALQKERAALQAVAGAVRARSAAGDVSGYDRGRLELELGSYDDLLAEAELELELARRVLGEVMGEPGARYDAADLLGLPSPPAAPAQLAAQALEARGDYRAARQQVTQAERELAAGRRGWVPDLTVTGGVKTAEVAGATASGYLAGVALTLPLFDHGQAERARARAHQREAQAEARVLERAVRAAVHAAYDRLSRRIAQADRFDKQQVGRLERLLRQAEVSYREGERPVFELLDAYRTARATRQRALELRREARRSEVELWRALGTEPGTKGKP